MEEETHENLARIEEARQKLENQIVQLRKSLKYWQTWEAEYEGFKEELESLGNEPTAEDIIILGANFGGTMINENEIKDLLGYGHVSSKTGAKMLDSLSKRVETGQKNAQSVQKQLDRAEAELDQLDQLDSTALAPSAASGDQPVMEIYEELDDRGNVISSRLVNADESTNAVDTIINKTSKGKSLPKDANKSTISPPLPSHSQPILQSSLAEAHSASTSTVPNPRKPVSGMKKPGLTALEGERMIELDDDENIIGESRIHSLNPNADSVAQHRAEVFETALQLGPVVATMDIDEDGDLSEGDYLDEEGIYEDDDDDGRRVIGYGPDELEDTGFEMDDVRQELTPEYIQEMEDLMRKYNQPMMGNIGPRDAGFPLATSLNPPLPKVTPLPEPPNEHATNEDNKTNAKKPSGKKGVRFADDLDIAADKATTTTPVAKENLPVRPRQPSTNDAIISNIVERAPAPTYHGDNPASKKVSRFKASRGSES